MIINEKIFVNDGKPTKVPLVLLLAASNELPERNKGLEALWDRFIIRMNLSPIQNEAKFLDLFANPENLLEKKSLEDSERFSLKMLQEVSRNAQYVKIPNNVRKFVSLLRVKIEQFNAQMKEINPNANDFDFIYVSDRK